MTPLHTKINAIFPYWPLYSVKCSITNQPINKYLSNNSLGHADMVEDDLLKFKLSIRMGKKEDCSGFEQACLSIFQTADPLGFSAHTNISRVYREYSQKRENIH